MLIKNISQGYKQKYFIIGGVHVIKLDIRQCLLLKQQKRLKIFNHVYNFNNLEFIDIVKILKAKIAETEE